jgi:hypothetical protein
MHGLDSDVLPTPIAHEMTQQGRARNWSSFGKSVTRRRSWTRRKLRSLQSSCAGDRRFDAYDARACGSVAEINEN